MLRRARWLVALVAISLSVIVVPAAAASWASGLHHASPEGASPTPPAQAARWVCYDSPEQCAGGGGLLENLLEVGVYLFLGAILISLAGELLGRLRPSERRRRAQQQADKDEALAKKHTDTEAAASQRRAEDEQHAANGEAAASWVASQQDQPPASRSTESREEQVAGWHEQDALRAVANAERRLSQMSESGRERVARASWVTPELLTRLADDPTVSVRQAVGESAIAPWEVMARLADDYYGLVRRAVARNPAAPSEIRDRANRTF